MNFVGHLHVANRFLGAEHDDSLDEQAFLVGAALPDLAAIGRFRLAGPAANPSVRAGVDLHHRTDDAFHRHPWFRRHSKAVSDDLERAGITRGAARACGHVGVELLLDGRLMAEDADLMSTATMTLVRAGADGRVERGEIERGVDRDRSGRSGRTDGGAARPALGIRDAVAAEHQARWRSHLRLLAQWDVPTDYEDPGAVAQRLQRILARRPRLALAGDGVDTVAAVLGSHQADLTVGVPALIADLGAELAPT